MKEVEVGYVANFFGNISVAAIVITSGSVSVGDTLHFVGHTTDFQSTIESMQVEHESVQEVKAGDSVGLKVPEKVRKTDKVFKVVEE
jgi:putative protease